MAEGSRPPQFALMASAAGGGFIGSILAIILIKMLMNPCCCEHDGAKQAAQLEPVTDNVVLTVAE